MRTRILVLVINCISLFYFVHKPVAAQEETVGAGLYTGPHVDAFLESGVEIIHEWRGESAGDEFGWIARNIGDVDGDRVADFVVSAPAKNVGGPQAGKVYVYSGKTGIELWTRAGGRPGMGLGRGVEAAGDTNGDGVPDVIVGAPYADRAFILSGVDGVVLQALSGDQPGERFGHNVSGAGDVNGDGSADVLVSAHFYDAGEADVGRVYLISGADGSRLHVFEGTQPGGKFGSVVDGWTRDGRSFLVIGEPDGGPEKRGRTHVYTDLSSEPDFTIESDDAGWQLGEMFLSVVGDADADGIQDIYVSDWAHRSLGQSTGKIVVHSGATGDQLIALTGEAAGDGFGIGQGEVGDINADGHDDLIVGAWQHDSGAQAAGRVYLYSGKDGTLIRTITSRIAGDTFGFDATGLGDVNGDGAIDYLLTAAWSGIRGEKSGRVFLISGHSGGGVDSRR